MKNFWCRYLVDEIEKINFAYVGPCWRNLYLDCRIGDVTVICFAIRAKSPEEVDSWFKNHFDEGDVVQKIHIREMEDDWVPFSKDFPREDWMVWPYRCVEENE